MEGTHGFAGEGRDPRQSLVIQQPITLTINGRERELPAELSLPALLLELGVDRRMVAVAHNGDVIPRTSYDGVTLHDGDRVEVVRMVGGG